MPTVAKTKTIVNKPVELPADPAEFAKHSVDQAQAAFDKANDLAHDNVRVFDATANAFKTHASELQLKATEFAQANVDSAFDFARKILAAPQPVEAFELQKAYLENQVKTLTKQMTELSTLSFKMAEETTKPVQNGVLKSFEEAKKAFAV